jgi:hypothetical protein
MFRRLTYANVTATLALFVALGGTSYAAATLPRDAVGARQLRANSVGSSEVRNRSLEVRDLSVRARRALLRPERVSGAPQGQQPSGTGSQPLVVTYKTASGTAAIAPADDTSLTAGSATCDADQRLLGGGVKLDDPSQTSVSDGFPNAAGTTWTAHVGNDDEAARHGFVVFAICAS